MKDPAIKSARLRIEFINGSPIERLAYAIRLCLNKGETVEFGDGSWEIVLTPNDIVKAVIWRQCMQTCADYQEFYDEEDDDE